MRQQVFAALIGEIAERKLRTAGAGARIVGRRVLKCFERLEPPRVLFDVLFDERTQLRYDRTELLPIERFVRDRADVLQILSPEARHREDFAPQRFLRIVEAHQRIEFDVAAATTPGENKVAAAN